MRRPTLFAATLVAAGVVMGAVTVLPAAAVETPVGPVTTPSLPLPPVTLPPVTTPRPTVPPLPGAPGSTTTTTTAPKPPPPGGGAPPGGAGTAPGGGAPAPAPGPRGSAPSPVLNALAGSGSVNLMPSIAANIEIPPQMLALYVKASRFCPGMSWTVLAAIGKVETDHGRNVSVSSAGAQGPMQFLPTTFAIYGVDASGDGKADINNPDDAVFSAMNYLCKNGAGDPARLYSAIFAYNPADWYVQTVLTYAAKYAAIPTLSPAGAVGTFALPVDPLVLAADPAVMTKPHHDYPAWDLPIPEGTPVFAVAQGVVSFTGGSCGTGLTITAPDGFSYTYCHGSEVLVPAGTAVVAGTPIMKSGNTGNSTGPHLHLQFNAAGGEKLCPQPVVQAWYAGIPSSPASAPNNGCTSGGGTLTTLLGSASQSLSSPSG